MTPYAQLPTDNPEEFIRTVGLSQEDFRHLNGKLAAVFGISESYCHKIYARTARMLVKLEKQPNRKALLEDPAATLAIDVSEQPIERPVKNQKAYYSGEKNATRSRPSL